MGPELKREVYPYETTRRKSSAIKDKRNQGKGTLEIVQDEITKEHLPERNKYVLTLNS